MGIEITTNNHVREVIEGYQLTEEERAEFDFIDWSKVEEGTDSASFVRYKGELIYIETGEGITRELQKMGWHFYQPDSFFSGHVFKWPKSDTNDNELDYDHIIVGTYYVKD